MVAITVELKAPNVPDFVFTITGEKIDVAALSNEEIDKLAKLWAVTLKATVKRRRESNQSGVTNG